MLEDSKDSDDMEEDVVDDNEDLIDSTLVRTLAYLSQLETPSDEVIQSLAKDVRIDSDEITKCIVLDMDETLLSATCDIDTEYYENQDKKMKVDYIVKSTHQSEMDCYKIKVRLRPHVKEVLQYLADLYSVVVFTAGTQEYADPILDELDPDGSLFSGRFYRHHGIRKDKFFVKDLRVISNFALKDIILVDNSIISFAFQLRNGVPINDFTGMLDEEEDQEMLFMVQFVQDIFEAEDVREPLEENFRLEHMVQEVMDGKMQA
jgi:Dullard-like phosphatase family protein